MRLYLGPEGQWSSREDNYSALTLFDYDVNRITATTLAGAEGREKLGHVGRQWVTRGAQGRGGRGFDNRACEDRGGDLLATRRSWKR
jgi:hypothetical protein